MTIAKIAALLLGLGMSSCAGQGSPDAADTGIMYISLDNGATWKNASAGLPASVSIGLGGIAVSEKMLAVATKEYGVFIYDETDSAWVGLPADSQMIKDNIGACTFYQENLYVGTQHGGIYYSMNKGKTWELKNQGLENLTIRRFAEIDHTLYAATNHGLYAYDETLGRWSLEYGYNGLQVNGIAEYRGSIYLASNQGVFYAEKGTKDWKALLPGSSLHNISACDSTLYAMSYTDLLLASVDGTSWRSLQKGLPENLYTFQVIKNEDIVFAAQWDGVYRRTEAEQVWQASGRGLPARFAVTNLKAYRNMLVLATSQRKPGVGPVSGK